MFALRRQIMLEQNLRAIHDRPYGQPFSTRRGNGLRAVPRTAASRFIQNNGIFHKGAPISLGIIPFFAIALAFFDDCTII